MKDLKQHILEKLKVSKTPISDITLESLINALKDYKERKHITNVYLDFKEILEEYPVVLQYHGTYTNENIVGEKIQAIQFIQYNTLYRSVMKNGKDAIFMHFSKIGGVAIQIENTEELYDIFGEEAVNKIYDYITKQ